MPPLHLTFVEEIVLLALDDATGARLPMPVMAYDYAIAGALLADLALLNRIDTDPQQLVVLNPAPTGDALLDPALAAIAAEPRPQTVSHWLSAFSRERAALEAAALGRLVAHGILRHEDKKILWVFGVRRYPTIDHHERIEVRTRLAALILGDELPDPRDAVLLSLLTAGHLTDRIFPGPQFTARSERLVTLAKMDLVGREVAAAVDAVTRAVTTAVPLGM
jgi:golgi phosphoprotein 3